MTKYLGLIFIAIFLVSCGHDENQQLGPKEIFDKAVALYKEGEYFRAQSEFDNLSYISAGTEYEDKSKFYLGMCYYKLENYLQASNSFDILIRTNPGSELIPESYYYKALCYYQLSPRYALDQTFAFESIAAFQTFIDYFPDNERVGEAIKKIDELRLKLAEKEYNNGVLYMKMEYYRSATIYFQYVIEKYYDTPFAEMANFRKIEALFIRKKWTDFVTEVDKFKQKYPLSEFMEEVDSFLKRYPDEKKKSEDDLAEIKSVKS